MVCKIALVSVFESVLSSIFFGSSQFRFWGFRFSFVLSPLVFGFPQGWGGFGGRNRCALFLFWRWGFFLVSIEVLAAGGRLLVLWLFLVTCSWISLRVACYFFGCFCQFLGFCCAGNVGVWFGYSFCFWFYGGGC